MSAKKTYILFFIIISFQCFSQNEYELLFYNCKANAIGTIHDGINIGIINIYDNITNEKIDYKEGNFSGEYIFKTTNLKVKIEYKNIFDQKIDTILKLDSNIKNHFICEETFIDNDSNKTSIEHSLEKRKKWKLNFLSSGCFHYDNESLEIRYINKVAYLEYKIRDSLKKTLILNENIISRLILFEKKLKLMDKPNSGCTTTDVYEIKSKYGKYKILDSSCLWDGFFELKKEIELK